MAGYENYNDGFYPNDGDLPLPPDDSTNNDPNDDFDPLELLQSPMFDENRGTRGSRGGGGGTDNPNDFEDFSRQQQSQQRQMPQVPPNMDASSQSHASHNSHASQQQQQQTPFSGPQGFGGGGQAPPQGSAGFPNQFGGMQQQQQQVSPNMQGLPGGPNQMTPQGMNAGMPGNVNGMPGSMNAMSNNFVPMQGGGPNRMGNPMQGAGGAPGGMNMNAMKNMNAMNPNAAAMNQMSLQGMQQALQMQAAGGNPMQGNMQGNVNPMMNAAAMQAAAAGGMGPGGPMMGGNMQGMGGAGMGPGGPMGPNMGGMTPVNRNGSLNTAVSQLNGSMNQMNMSGPQNGNMHASMPNMQGGQFPQPRGASLPTSPNAVPSVAQMSASVRAGNSSRTGGRTRGPTPKVDSHGKVIANTSADPGINEAMEKLCESMRRSAMSRNLVKQLSGRSVQRQGSSRSLSRSNSGVGMRKQMMGRSLSGNLGKGDDGSGRGTPTRVAPIRRLSNSKHRLHARAAPGNRGTFRANSMGSQASVASQGQNTFLQLDDQSLGAL